MQLALEAPTKLLEMVYDFADFDWVLAHKVLEDEEYKKFYKGSKRVKFIDNSVNEKGEPLSLEVLKEVFEEVEGTYIVAPDWIGKEKETLEAFGKCVETFGRERTVGVVQGSSFKEAFECVQVYGKGMVAVPYDICSSKEDPPWLMGLRRALVTTHIPNDRYVHLLGFDSIDEFYWYVGKSHIVSIDTGIPVLLGMREEDILDPLKDKKQPTLNQADEIELTQTGWTAICRNIALLRKYLVQ